MNFNAKSLNSPVKKLQLLLNKKGSSLIIVLVSFAVLMIMGAALVIVVSYNHKNATDYHKKQQAQYTARGVMESLVSAFSNPAIGGTVVAKIPDSPSTLDGSGDLTADNMGSYKVMLNYTDGSKKKIKADVIATYQGMSYKLTAYFKQGKGDRMNPHDFVLFSPTGAIKIAAAPSGTSTNIHGKVFSMASLMTEDTIFHGKVLSLGAVDMLKNCRFKDNLILRGSYNNNQAYKNVYEKTVFAEGDVTNIPDYVEGGVVKNVPAFQSVPTGKIGIENGIGTHMKKWSTVYVVTSGTDATDFTFNSVFKFNWNSGVLESPVGTTISGTTYTLPNGDKFDTTTKIYTAENGDSADISAFTSITYGKGDTSAYPVQPLSGNISTGNYKINGSQSTGIVALDTTGGDIHLYAQNNIEIRHDMNITGENNVYIHLAGNSINFAGGNVGKNDFPDQHQLSIEGEGGTIKIGGDATLKAAIYMFDGTYEESYTTAGDYINGSITAKTIKLTPGNTYTYCDYLKDPIFDATIVDPTGTTPYFIYPQNTTGEKDWVLEGYKK